MRSPWWRFWRKSAHICRWKSWLTDPRRSLVHLVHVMRGDLQWVLQMLAVALTPGVKPTFKSSSLTLHRLEHYSFRGSPKRVLPGRGGKGWLQDSDPSCGFALSSGGMTASVCIQRIKGNTEALWGKEVLWAGYNRYSTSPIPTAQLVTWPHLTARKGWGLWFTCVHTKKREQLS